MISTFSGKQLLYFFAALLLIGGLIVLATRWLVGLNPPETLGGLIRLLPLTVSAAGALLWILSHHVVVNGLWRIFPGLGYLVPNLNGTYELHVESNWPQKTRICAPDQGSSVGGEEEREAEAALLPVRGTLRVSAGLFRMRISYKPDTPGPSRSHTEVIGTALRRNPNSGEFELFYVFEGRIHTPVPTDDPSYFGAAALKVVSDRGRVREMRGHYWTNRGWHKGLNTAGHVAAIRSDGDGAPEAA